MKLGIDLGSSTSKIAIFTHSNELAYTQYKKHNGKPVEALELILQELPEFLQKEQFDITITGTAGMGLAHRTKSHFVQEVLAVSKSVKTYYPNAKAVIELGGEDAKFIYFQDNGSQQMRMNGSCAGGTGSFIEQIAALLHVDLGELNSMAHLSTRKLNIASRCGVFAKTDVQAHLNQGQNKNDIARSVFRAVANQYIVAMVAGTEVDGDIVFTGGPLSFFDMLRTSFKEILPIDGNYILPDNSREFVAIGAALLCENKRLINYKELLKIISNSKEEISLQSSLKPLFESTEEYEEFQKRHEIQHIRKASNSQGDLFIGIDAGSTTSKMMLVNANKELLGEYYSSNKGEPLQIIQAGFESFKEYLPQVKAIFSTGYGEELTQHAFGIDGGVVETFAHYRAGLEFNKDINFVLDIGGQDVKAIYLDNGLVTDIDLNEACSSGTGSFIETFAHNMNMSIEEFVKKSLFAEAPMDLGTRCTVFMNSKVKDALRDGYNVSDISAGLCYSVVRNTLYKVIRVKDLSKLGKNILVQGGTFKNDAVLRAFEKITGKDVIRIEQAHLMGAYGAAIYALEHYSKNPQNTKDYSNIYQHKEIVKDIKHIKCKGCGNLCNVTKFIFDDERVFYVENNCDKYFSNSEKKISNHKNFFHKKYKLFYADVIDKIHNQGGIKIGIPLVLEMYEHFPFYIKLFRDLGFDIEVSHWTTEEIYSKGIRTQLVDNLCFPAKIVNGHIEHLMEKNVDRIFYPIVQFEQKSDDMAANAFNCPIVTGYPVIIQNSYNSKIPIDALEVSFIDQKMTRKKFISYFKNQFGISASLVSKAFDNAMQYENRLRNQYLGVGRKIVNEAIKNNQPLIVIAGRTYHIDPLVNHGLMDQAEILGAQIISEEVASAMYKGDLTRVEALTQWSYHNRLYKSALWLKDLNYDNSAILQLTSFGCGPDAITIDEMKSLSREAGRPYVNIKIDEMANLGAIKIRIKSLMKTWEEGYKGIAENRVHIQEFERKKDQDKLIIGPYFADFYNEVLEAVFVNSGFNLVIPKNQEKNIIDVGLKYVNNDMCYPAIIIIGDIINQLENYSGNNADITIALSETGGQCRASNYSTQLKQALRNAGFTDVKVGTLNTTAGKDSYQMNQLKMLNDFAVGFSLADAIKRMEHSIRPYEKQRGSTDTLVEKLKIELREFVINRKFSRASISDYIDRCINRFNDIEIYDRHYGRVGIVGEIYMKSNSFSNNHIARWLENKGFEVEQPGIVKFLQMDYYSGKYNSKNSIEKTLGRSIRELIINKRFERNHSLIEERLKQFKRYRQEYSIKDYIDENIISRSIQFGEAWLLPLEVSIMAKNGVKNIVALQPFGCISNHIIAKGMVNKINEEFPAVKFLTLDFESGSANVNIYNRLELFLNDLDFQD
jgi:predicted CoA-substrate-specific enzyme activase